jgi:hypothetical protein
MVVEIDDCCQPVLDGSRKRMEIADRFSAYVGEVTNEIIGHANRTGPLREGVIRHWLGNETAG